MTWSTISAPRGNVVHVIPDADVVEHSESFGACVCGPRVEAMMCTAVSVASGRRITRHCGWMITHHSLDGREHLERAS